MKFAQQTLFALFILATTFNTYSMEPKPTKKKSRIQRVRGWVNVVGQSLLGNVPTQQLPALMQQSEQFPFTALPKDEQNTIIGLLTTGANAESLIIAASTINSLAQVNKELNALINNPQFCLQIIKSLAKKFNCSDFEVCSALKTQQAKVQLALQTQLKDLCKNTELQPESLGILLLRLRNQGADLNFTYIFGKNELTPLLIAIYSENLFAYSLIAAGADPEFATKDGITALQAARETNNQELIKFIQDTIGKKHEKK